MSVYWSVLALAVAVAAAGGALLTGASAARRTRAIARHVAAVARSTAAAPDRDTAGPTTPLLARLGRPFDGAVRLIVLADWRLRAWHAALLAALAIVMASAGWMVAGAAGGALGIAASPLAPWAAARAAARRNERRFAEQLPGFLERLRQLLVSGNSLISAFDKALGYSDPVVRAFLGPVSVRLANGVGLAEALRIQGQRLGNSETAMLAVIAHANLRFGGSLGDILEHLIRALRGRSQLRREFEALTAETRSSARVLFALPLVVAGFMFLTHPSYFAFFLEDPMGKWLIGYAVASNLAGMLVLRRMADIRP